MPDLPTVILPLVIALLTLAGGYLNSVRLEQKKARLAFVSEQLKSLYGPLYSLSQASMAAWTAFRTHHRPTGVFFDPANPPSPTELEEWRRWMKLVFTPMNERMVGAIVGHADLIAEPRMPASFLALIAHVEAYRVVLARWDAGDFSQNTSVINFPETLNDDVEQSFNALKDVQARLMSGATASRRPVR